MKHRDYIECCLECNEELEDVPNQEQFRWCINVKCKLYKRKVSNWYNFDK